MKYVLSKKLIYLVLWNLCMIPLNTQGQRLLHKNIHLPRTSGTVHYFLKELQQQYQINFSYDEKVLPKQSLKVTKTHWLLKDFLQKLLQNTRLQFIQISDQIIIKKDKNAPITLNGNVTSKADGEQLIGATVYIKELNTGAVTNAYGFYSITVPPGKYTFIYAYMGYQRKVHTMPLEQNQVQDVALSSLVDHLNEVEVKASQEENIESIEAVQMSAHTLETVQIKTTPMLAGEADVLKSFQFLPGIQNGSEGTANFSVRGGSYDQNLILLDDAPVYNVSHALGFFSIFNVDAIHNIRVYKGGIPAQYGGRLSSVIDIRMKEGNDQKFALNGGIGLAGSRLTVEGPIGKKVSYLIAGRYSYLGKVGNLSAQYIKKPIPGVKKFGLNNAIDFYDLNAKINLQVNEHNRIYLSGFMGKDHFFNELAFEDNTLDWGNQTGTFRWNHIYNARLFSNLTMIYSNFDYSYVIQNNTQHFKWMANQQQQALKLDFDYFASPRHTFNFGLALHHHRFNPGRLQALDRSLPLRTFSLDTKKALETAAYVSHKYQINDQLSLNYGLRFSTFHNLGDGIQYIYAQQRLQEEKIFANNAIMHSYFGLAPRFSLRYLLTSTSAVKGSYSRTYQYLHQISNTSIGLPTDVWLPVDNNIKPQFADQIAIGYFKEIKQARYSFSAEAYYKWIYQIIDYKDNANIFLNKNIETQISNGKGKAYGLELMVEKKKGKFKGWLSYTLSKVERNIPGANNNLAYSPRYDRRHNLSLVLSHDLGKKWQVSANYSIISGAGITVPQGVYLNGGNNIIQYYSARNAFKLPVFHQLDISFKFKSHQNTRWQDEWILGITNVYNRKNPVIYYLTNYHTQRQISHLYLFGVMPSINYNFKF